MINTRILRALPRISASLALLATLLPVYGFDCSMPGERLPIGGDDAGRDPTADASVADVAPASDAPLTDASIPTDGPTGTADLRTSQPPAGTVRCGHGTFTASDAHGECTTSDSQAISEGMYLADGGHGPLPRRCDAATLAGGAWEVWCSAAPANYVYLWTRFDLPASGNPVPACPAFPHNLFATGLPAVYNSVLARTVIQGSLPDNARWVATDGRALFDSMGALTGTAGSLVVEGTSQDLTNFDFGADTAAAGRGEVFLELTPQLDFSCPGWSLAETAVVAGVAVNWNMASGG